MERYQKNIGTLTIEENARLEDARVCVLGCGGLGGYVIEMLGRLGVGTITAVDGGDFEPTNLNRQILCDEKTLGRNKALMAAARMALVNPEIKVVPVPEVFTRDNGSQILAGHHLAIDALDNVPSRLLLQDLAEALEIPFVHGAIAGWYGQVATIFPGDRSLAMIYTGAAARGIEAQLGNPSFTPAVVAAIEVGEALKILIGRGDLLRRKILQVNLLQQEYTLIDL